jgi:hypothetical protein
LKYLTCWSVFTWLACWLSWELLAGTFAIFDQLEYQRDPEPENHEKQERIELWQRRSVL